MINARLKLHQFVSADGSVVIQIHELENPEEPLRRGVVGGDLSDEQINLVNDRFHFRTISAIS